MNIEIKRIIIDKGYYSEDEYPFTIKPNFSTLGRIIEVLPQGSIISFVFNDSIRSLHGFHDTIFYKEYNLSPYPGDILSFDNLFLETDIAKVMILRGKRNGIFHNFTMDVDSGYKFIEKHRAGVQCYMMNTKDFISSFNFILKNENGDLASFNGQSIRFRISTREV